MHCLSLLMPLVPGAVRSRPLLAVITPLTSILCRASDEGSIAQQLLAMELGRVLACCSFASSDPQCVGSRLRVRLRPCHAASSASRLGVARLSSVRPCGSQSSAEARVHALRWTLPAWVALCS